MPDSQYARLERYLAGELSKPEQRALAQAALDDPELFELLTVTSALRAVVMHDVAAARATPGAEIVLHLRPRFPVADPPNRAGSADSLHGVDSVAARGAAMPVLLIRRPYDPALTAASASLPPPGASSVERDRFDDHSSRPPTQAGSIVALDDGVATIDMGTVDGLFEGSVLTSIEAAAPAVESGRLIVIEVSPVQARARAVGSGTLTVGDRIETSAEVYLTALAAAASIDIARDDLAAARWHVERALRLVEAPGGRASQRRVTLAQLGAIEYRLHALTEAEGHFRAAKGGFDEAPPASPEERAQVLNELAAVLIARGAYAEAEAVLLEAQAHAGQAGVLAGPVVNNLAAVAVLSGDPEKAALLYAAALDLSGRSPEPSRTERNVIENNLAALGSWR